MSEKENRSWFVYYYKNEKYVHMKRHQKGKCFLYASAIWIHFILRVVQIAHILNTLCSENFYLIFICIVHYMSTNEIFCLGLPSYSEPKRYWA